MKDYQDCISSNKTSICHHCHTSNFPLLFALQKNNKNEDGGGATAIKDFK